MKLIPLTAETAEIIISLHVCFQDYKKIIAWLTTKNPLLGSVMPIYLIETGRTKKLLKFINAALDEGGY